ncbi:MAG TPA: hypothetical protein VL003_04870 [Pusillimonas sp.]|uniref:hypothetical protein n=1 Tax=Pusillimonas sp. TaxID=3040095 RepID=UPI002BA50E4F|nr:hypothetical protein [Pusillimonas sp.]HUH87368.1 hypothetical protein [Pusillimonas sp.]
MKSIKSTKRIFGAVALALPLAVATMHGMAWAQADHAHDSAAHSAMELNQGRKWGIDAPLRHGMNALHSDITTALNKVHDGKMSEADYDKLAESVNTQFLYIVENCKLEPAPDAQLHIVLGNVMQGLEAVKGNVPQQNRADGVVKIAQTLNTYGQFFEHEGWKPIDLAH